MWSNYYLCTNVGTAYKIGTSGPKIVVIKMLLKYFLFVKMLTRQVKI